MKAGTAGAGSGVSWAWTAPSGDPGVVAACRGEGFAVGLAGGVAVLPKRDANGFESRAVVVVLLRTLSPWLKLEESMLHWRKRRNTIWVKSTLNWTRLSMDNIGHLFVDR